MAIIPHWPIRITIRSAGHPNRCVCPSACEEEFLASYVRICAEYEDFVT